VSTVPRILLVEDTPDIREVVRRKLARLGYEVVTAEDGEQAVARAKADRPDLILMDLGLPGIDGWEATRRIRADPDTVDIPVIALSAHVLDTDRQKAMSVGCDDFEPKPLQFQVLVGKVERLLAKAARPADPPTLTMSGLAAELAAPAVADTQVTQTVATPPPRVPPLPELPVSAPVPSRPPPRATPADPPAASPCRPSTSWSSRTTTRTARCSAAGSPARGTGRPKRATAGRRSKKSAAGGST
jgi:CheY-like chemotaxis protein